MKFRTSSTIWLPEEDWRGREPTEKADAPRNESGNRP